MTNIIEIPRLSVMIFKEDKHEKILWDIFNEYRNYDDIHENPSNYLDIYANIITKYCFGWCHSLDMPDYMQSCIDDAYALMFGANSKELIGYHDEEYEEFWFHVTPHLIIPLLNKFPNIKFLDYGQKSYRL